MSLSSLSERRLLRAVVDGDLAEGGQHVRPEQADQSWPQIDVAHRDGGGRDLGLANLPVPDGGEVSSTAAGDPRYRDRSGFGLHQTQLGGVGLVDDGGSRARIDDELVGPAAD